MILLASASPRRRALLAAAGVEFEVEVAGVDEDLAGRPAPVAAAVELALRKARAVARRHPGEALAVLGADTVVAVPKARAGSPPAELADGADWELLGKPADPREAAAMLAKLSGTRHAVVTGLAVVRAADGAWRTDHERTWVTMRAITAAEVGDYVSSEEWRDKAGGYAIQETADRFVVRLEGGGFDNVVGLPVERALALARALGEDVGPGRPL